MDILTRCPFCGESHIVHVSMEGYIKWEYEDASVQEAFPELSADDRELLITGICPKCWDKMFA